MVNNWLKVKQLENLENLSGRPVILPLCCDAKCSIIKHLISISIITLKSVHAAQVSFLEELENE